MRKENTTTDYLVAGRKVSPWLTALSSMATNNSGYAFIGIVGFAYRSGIHSLWLTIGWITGDLLVWLFVHKRVRQVSGELDARSVPVLLGTDRYRRTQRTVVILAGVLTFVFLSVYAAAQLKAGGTALQSLFGWEMATGVIIGAVVVVLYCFSGGLRASIWTDAAQSFVMMFGMAMLLTISFSEIGGPTALLAQLRAVDPALGEIWPQDLAFGFGIYFIGFVAGGFGAIGAPHILIRSMALDSVDHFRRTRLIYLSTFIPFVLASAIIGLYARLMLPELGDIGNAALGLATDADLSLVQKSEQALPLMAIALLPEFLVGMVLAAIFAANMSTADSQILACSAAMTQDIEPRWQQSYMASKMSTLVVTALATSVALFAGEGVFALVLYAWSALGAGLGPVLLLRLSKQPCPAFVAMPMMMAGVVTVIAWDMSPYASDVYKLLPGLIVPFALYAVARATGLTAKGESH